MVGYSSNPGYNPQTANLKYNVKPQGSPSGSLASKQKSSLNLNSQIYSQKSSKPKSPSTKPHQSNGSPKTLHQKQSASPRPRNSPSNLTKQSPSPRPFKQSPSPRPLMEPSSPKPIPGKRTRNPSSSSSVSSMSISPSPSSRSLYSPSRSSPTVFASSTCYQPPVAGALPLPPLQWTGRCAPVPVLDPTAQLKLLLNVQF